MNGLNLEYELAAMATETIGQLHDRYAALFGERPRSRHRQYLIRRIAWGLQANAEGGLSERALKRAEELADIRDARTTPPRARSLPRPARVARLRVDVPSDPRLPSVGTQITRRYRSRVVAVTVLADGFEYDGRRYRSLSAVAKAVTGSHMNGFRFFGLEAKP